jgi:hypothetical protein
MHNPTTNEPKCALCASFEFVAPEPGPATETITCHGEVLTFHAACLQRHLARFTCAFHGDD